MMADQERKPALHAALLACPRWRAENTNLHVVRAPRARTDDHTRAQGQAGCVNAENWTPLI